MSADGHSVFVLRGEEVLYDGRNGSIRILGQGNRCIVFIDWIGSADGEIGLG